MKRQTGRRSVVNPRALGYIRITEAVEQFGISRDTLDRRAAEGELQQYEGLDPEIKRGDRMVTWVMPDDVRRLLGPRPKTVQPPDGSR
jgi:hypothetical protein